MTHKEFWEWFLTRKPEIEKFMISDTDDYSLYHELTTQLKNYHELVLPELTMDANNNYILILSCDGRQEGIEPVEKLFENAPIIDKWKIQKFRAPGHVIDLNYGGLSFKSDDIKVKYNFDGHYYNIELFIKGYDNSDDRYKSLAFLYLDHLVGEYNVMTKIGQIEFKKLGLFTATKDKVSLQGFRAIIERLN